MQGVKQNTNKIYGNTVKKRRRVAIYAGKDRSKIKRVGYKIIETTYDVNPDNPDDAMIISEREVKRVLNPNGKHKNSTSTEVRSPTSTETSTEAYTKDNVTVTGGAGAGATTKVTIVNRRNPKGYSPFNKTETAQRYRIALRQLKNTPYSLELRDEISRYGSALGYSNERINADFNRVTAAIIKGKKNSTAADFRSHQKLRLADLIKMFQGEHRGEKKRVVESDYTPKDKYKLGYLVQMKIKDAGKTVPISFDGESYLAADLRNNLLVVGKDSRLTGVKLPPKGQLKYLGELIQFDYVTAKRHIGGGKTIRFYHKTGEVTGEHPNLLMDNEGFLIIQGGGYDIWDVGVVN